MNIPRETKPALWGVAGGAIALAIVGFTWGGWVTGGKAQRSAKAQADDAVVAALAPVCVDHFKRTGDAPANLAALKKLDAWLQGDFVEKGGWAAIVPASADAAQRTSAVAKACAVLLSAA
jgi:alpha/beta superfamily hydrolase